MTMLEALALLVAGHMLMDYPLQGDFLAKGKNHRAPLPGIPWGWPLAAHAVLHGAVVGLVLGSLVLALAETLAHAAIDHAKCAGRLNFHEDQAAHLACKVTWWLAWPLLMGAPA